MAFDLTQFGSLETDSPPDGLGDRAWRLKNVMPRSSRTVSARNGVSEAVLYSTGTLGRVIIVDGLPENTEGVMISCVNTTASGADFVQTVTRVDAFWPRFSSSRYSEVSGLNISELLYGVTT